MSLSPGMVCLWALCIHGAENGNWLCVKPFSKWSDAILQGDSSVSNIHFLFELHLKVLLKTQVIQLLPKDCKTLGQRFDKPFCFASVQHFLQQDTQSIVIVYIKINHNSLAEYSWNKLFLHRNRDKEETQYMPAHLEFFKNLLIPTHITKSKLSLFMEWLVDTWGKWAVCSIRNSLFGLQNKDSKLTVRSLKYIWETWGRVKKTLQTKTYISETILEYI